MTNRPREYAIFNAELRTDAETGKLKGYAVVFNSLSLPIADFREVVKPGAFTKTLQESDIRALFNHDSNFVLGRNRANTLTLTEDAHGLLVEIDPPDTQWAKDLRVSIERGDINQMSFGFRCIKDNYIIRSTDNPDSEYGTRRIREIVQAELFDVSPVTFPAYPETEIYARSIGEIMSCIDDDAKKIEAESYLKEIISVLENRYTSKNELPNIDQTNSLENEPTTIAEPVKDNHSVRDTTISPEILRRKLELKAKM